MCAMSDEPPPDSDVLGSLPRTRPARRSAKRDTPAKATTAKPKAAKPTKAKAKRDTPAKAPAPKPRARLTPPAPAPTRASAPPASGYAVPEPDPHPGSGDLLTMAAEAALWIAQLGLRLGLRTVRAVVDRRPGGDGDA
jgi:hypothetical protein